VLAATVLGSSMAFIDSTVVNVALPALQRDLSAGAGAVQWVVNAYMLLLGACVLVGGAAGDRYGRRRVFILGIVLFTLASVACGLAPNAAVLIAARAVQGLGAALLTPSSLAILNSSFPDDERGRAVGAWAGFGALTTAVGPVLGGWLVDAVSWRAIFFINVPIGALAIWLALRHTPESRDDQAGPLDWKGALLAAAGLGALTWSLTAGPDRGFRDAGVVGAAAGGGLLLAGFLLAEARERHPMMPLHLFRNRCFSGVNGLTLLLYFALGGAMFFLPFDLIRVQGWRATEAGAALIPFAVVMGLGSAFAGRLADRIGPRLPLTVGPVVTGLGFALLSRADVGSGYWTGYFPAILVMSLGMTLAVGPLTATVMGAVEPRHAGLASGVNNAVARVAGLMAVAVLGVVLSVVFAGVVDGADPRKALAEVMAGQGDTPGRAAFHHAVGVVELVCGVCAALGGVVGFLTVNLPPAQRPEAAASG
jgi:EmrB/QacA subfamily drug resistance transporter